MKKILSTCLIISFCLAIPSIALAQRQPAGSGSTQQGTGDGSNQATAPQGNLEQNQVKTQNAGEESQLEVNTQSNEQNSDSSSSASRSDKSRQNMSEVAKQVEVLLNDDTIEGGVGQQVKDIAQQQQQAQGEIKGQLDKLESRSGLVKALIGNDRKAIKNLKQQMEQNQLRIQELQQLQNQVANEGEETQIKALIQALTEQNTSLAEQIQAEENVNGIFGWLIGFFS